MKTLFEIRRDNPEAQGMEIFEVTPILAGGSPVDPTNKVLLTREQHIEAVRYWNQVIKKLRDQEKPEDI